MRNEIFARYGHRFKKGGAMDKHFREQAWYQNLPAPQKAMQSLLSQIEKGDYEKIDAIMIYYYAFMALKNAENDHLFQKLN